MLRNLGILVHNKTFLIASCKIYFNARMNNSKHFYVSIIKFNKARGVALFT